MSKSTAFGRLLRFWRGVHSLSQEQLADRLDSSPRHISRLENGSSRPSEAMAMDIARALSLGRRDQSHLLVAAGFTPREAPIDFFAPDMKWLRTAMTRSLRALDPYPASLLDSASNILMVNRAWVGFHQRLMPAEELREMKNFYEFMFSSQSAENAVSNWPDTLSAILLSIQQNALLRDDPATQATVDRLSQCPSVPRDWRQRAASVEPMASFRVQIPVHGELQRFFSVNTTVGALGPTAFVSEPMLSISSLYPEDSRLNLDELLNGNLEHPLLFY
ncbi:helix-turn-helix domain-containing protein [Spongiibacter tropicus]|uniref:helix-turn-helix domain-containing protein n=1 Tax=Spongiibacter tropicus TaxID=454602 RepID=UPI0003B5BB63|nr:helix-turn-helix domain-containing protein [Spongiibacter tropicus]